MPTMKNAGDKNPVPVPASLQWEQGMMEPGVEGTKLYHWARVHLNPVLLDRLAGALLHLEDNEANRHNLGELVHSLELFRGSPPSSVQLHIQAQTPAIVRAVLQFPVGSQLTRLTQTFLTCC